MERWTLYNGKEWKERNTPVKTAPVQVINYHVPKIPYPVAEEAYKEYSARYGTRQTLERLNERGGFSWSELAILLYERCQRLEKNLDACTKEVRRRADNT